MKKITIAMLVMLCTSSCAVMFQGSKKDVTIRSMTPNASIYIDGDLAGQDAVTQRLTRKDDHTIIVKKDGCDNKIVEIKKHTQVGWIIFDALFNWFAFATDAPTGAWNTFDKDHVVVELPCSTTTATK